MPQTEILRSDFGTQTAGGEGGGSSQGQPLSEPQGDAVSSFLRGVLPELEAALEGNTNSTSSSGEAGSSGVNTAFAGYLLSLGRGEGHREEAALWRTLSVDLEKHKVGRRRRRRKGGCSADMCATLHHCCPLLCCHSSPHTLG